MGVLIGNHIQIGGGILIGSTPPVVLFLVEEDLTTQIVSEASSGSQNIIEENS